MKFKKLFKRDDWILGISIGIVVPGILFLILFPINNYTATLNHGVSYLQVSTVLLISIFSNLFTFRYYMVKIKYDRTGRGILLSTFLYAAVFFILFLGK